MELSHLPFLNIFNWINKGNFKSVLMHLYKLCFGLFGWVFFHISRYRYFHSISLQKTAMLIKWKEVTQNLLSNREWHLWEKEKENKHRDTQKTKRSLEEIDWYDEDGGKGKIRGLSVVHLARWEGNPKP